MNNDEMILLRDSINTILELSNKEKEMKARKLNNYFIVGGLCKVYLQGRAVVV